jgi:hypothetical protein
LIKNFFKKTNVGFEKSIEKNNTNMPNFENNTKKNINTGADKMLFSSPLLSLSETEIRDLCRHHIDSFENWSRRLIDELFRENYDSDYLHHMISQDISLVKSEIRSRIEKRVSDNPNRFPRIIDAILIEDIEYFFCREDLYKNHFKGVLEPFFSGRDEIRSVLNRIIPIRNKLSHGNSISTHEAEQCICYCNDFISTFKDFYETIGKEKIYNVPVFIRIKDSLGHDFVRDNTEYDWELHSFQIPKPKIQLRSGEQYKLWVEVDTAFDSSFYEIKWVVKQKITDYIKKGTGNTIFFTLTDKNVSYSPEIDIILVTKRNWHRFGEIDDHIVVHLEEVLPPIEDTY